MDELQISGKRFISSRRIARENGYTSDYIGQLIRGGKITGQKVGRAWYVDAASFDAYLGAEGAVLSEVVTAIPEPEAVAVSVIEPAAEIIEAPLVVEEGVVEEAAKIEVAPVVEAEEVAAVVAAEKEEEKETEPEIVAEPVSKIEVAVIPEPVLARMQPEAVHHIPLRLFKKEEKTDVKAVPAGLRYYADDAPALPEIPSNKKESRIPAPVQSSFEGEEKVVIIEKVKSNRPVLFGGLVLASITVFIFCAVVSSVVSLNLTVSEGNAAAASYGLDW